MQDGANTLDRFDDRSPFVECGDHYRNHRRRAIQITDWPKKDRNSGSSAFETGMYVAVENRICPFKPSELRDWWRLSEFAHQPSPPIGLK